MGFWRDWFKPSSKIFYLPFQGGTSFVDHLCLVFVILSRLFIAALWSPAGKGLTCWLLFVMFNCVFVTFPCGILGQVWYLIVSIPDLCRLSYFMYLIVIPGNIFWLWYVMHIKVCHIGSRYTGVFAL